MKLHLSLSISLALLIPVIALADEASDHTDKATRFYNLQDWPNALKEYKAAYGLDPKPDTLWAIAQTQRLSGDCRAATLTYKAYMRGASAAGANAAQSWIEQCQATLAAQQKALDDATRPAAPPRPVAVVAPPPPPPAAALPPPPPPAHASAHHRSVALDPLADTLSAIALVGLAGGSTYLYLGNRDMTAAAQKVTYQQYDHAVDAARTEQHLGTYALIGGAVFAGLAAWRFASVASHDEPEQLQAGVLPGGGAVVTYGGRF